MNLTKTITGTMKPLPAIPTASRIRTRTGIVVLGLIGVLLGLGAGVYWYHGAAKTNLPPTAPASANGLPEVMTATLSSLAAPVEIRFYGPADPKRLPGDLPAFVGRVGQLLAWYEQEAGGKIRVTRLDPQQSREAGATAKADGIKPVLLASGDFYHLGLVVGYHGRREILAPLAPEWELALESDLSRAILRVTSAPSTAPRAASVPDADPAAAREIVQEITRAIPNWESLTPEEGAQILRQRALEQCQATIRETQPLITAAQAKLAAAQRDASEPEQQTARKQFQQVQTEQNEKIQQISQRAQDQIAALEQLKRAGR